MNADYICRRDRRRRRVAYLRLPTVTNKPPSCAKVPIQENAQCQSPAWAGPRSWMRDCCARCESRTENRAL